MSKNYDSLVRVRNSSVIVTLATLLVLSGVSVMLSPAQQLAFADSGKDKHDDKKHHDDDKKKKHHDDDKKKFKDKLKDKYSKHWEKFAYDLVDEILAKL